MHIFSSKSCEVLVRTLSFLFVPCLTRKSLFSINYHTAKFLIIENMKTVCSGCGEAIQDACFYSRLRNNFREVILDTVFELLILKHEQDNIPEEKIWRRSELLTEAALDALGRMMFKNEECHNCTWSVCMETDFYMAIINDFVV